MPKPTSDSSRDQLPLPNRGRPKRARPEPATAGRTHVVAGLFAGIGGIERGLARHGHEAALLCENDPAAMAVLADKFASIPLHEDVQTLPSLPQEISLITAGFPCQDLSQAGRTRGIAGARSGLIGHVFRLIETHHTPWVLLENVPFMLQLAGGEAMNVITETFEAMEYKWAYRVVDSRAFGVPQRRRRVYFLASREGDPREVLFADEKGAPPERGDFRSVPCGFYWTEGIRGLGWAVDAVPTLKGGSTIGIPSAPAIIFPDGRVGMPSIRDAERLQGFRPDWTRAAEKVAKKGTRWKLVGNAVTVKAAEWIGRRLARPAPVHEFTTHPINGVHAWPSAAWNVGSGRYKVDASEFPVRHKYKSLAEFLKDDVTPLSAKATAGFLSRAERGGLRFPPEFLATLRVHLERVSSGSAPGNRKTKAA